MDYAGADLQGALGYMFVKAFRNEFRRRGLKREPVAVVTQTLVDPRDPAFADPSKPIGSHMEEAQAKTLAAQQGWVVKPDAGRGWRRVVPSPRPQRILDHAVIGHLARAGYLVIACGGGGIPVIENEAGDITGVEAVIDKDFASSLLARSLSADLFLVSTGVERVAIDWGKPSQRWLDHMSLAEAKRHLAEDQFDRGSMGPKIEALIDFVEGANASGGGGKEGLITSPDQIGRALSGATGTRIARG